MFKVLLPNDQVVEFATHAEASRYVVLAHRARVPAKLLTPEVRNDYGRIGNFMDQLRPVHNFSR